MIKFQVKRLLGSVKKWNKWRKENPKKRIDFYSAYLNRVDLRDADLHDADLNYADLNNANLNHANLNHANLRYTNLTYADLSNADLSNADLHGCILCDANLDGAKISYREKIIKITFTEVEEEKC